MTSLDGPYVPFVNGCAHATADRARVLEIVADWDDGAIRERTSTGALPSQVFFVGECVAFATSEQGYLVLDVMPVATFLENFVEDMR